jgi:hypothetical protein
MPRSGADERANVAGSADENQPLARQAAKRTMDACGGSTRSDLALLPLAGGWRSKRDWSTEPPLESYLKVLLSGMGFEEIVMPRGVQSSLIAANNSDDRS